MTNPFARREVPLPDIVAAMPLADADVVPCPYCGQVLEPPPRRARVCEHCGRHFRVWGDPDGVRRVLTLEAQYALELHRVEVYPPMSIGVIVTIGEQAERDVAAMLDQRREDARQFVHHKYHRLLGEMGGGAQHRVPGEE